MASDSEEEVMQDLSKEVDATQDPKATTALDALKTMSQIACDTAEYEEIAPYYPVDVSTNPSLILEASKKDEYSHFIKKIVSQCKEGSGSVDDKVARAMDLIPVGFGTEMLSILHGKVSTELDVRLSYNSKATMKKAREIVALYEAKGVARNKVLVKIAGTPEGIRAAKQLQREGIHCNITLVFSLAQVAKACDARASVISPFVGRISDLYARTKKETKEDPGVKFARDAYNYVHGNNFHPSPMVQASSFRNKDQILNLAGCDIITISPALLKELSKTPAVEVERKLLPPGNAVSPIPKMEKMGSKVLRWTIATDEIANELLCDGIRRFARDTEALEKQVREWICA